MAPSVTEQWTIQNYSLEYYAFHIHQIHFRDVTAGSLDPLDAPLLDTVNVPPAVDNEGFPGAPGQTKIRLTFTRAQIGEFVFHCHVLEHEDNGMMQKTASSRTSDHRAARRSQRLIHRPAAGVSRPTGLALSSGADHAGSAMPQIEPVTGAVPGT